MSSWTIASSGLRHMCPNLTEGEAERIARGLGEAFQRFEINTDRRAAMAVAQWAHESDHFRTGTEYASGAAYEGRADLGNVRRGDGVRFKGRGRIMITGRANYAAIADALGLDCINHPEILAKSPHSEMASGHWWHAHGCNAFCDRDDFEGLTRRINGGLNGLKDRRALYSLAREVAGGFVPRNSWDVLVRGERVRMEALAAGRRSAKRHGGWAALDPSHRARASEAKRWLVARRKKIWHIANAEANGWQKANRRARYDLIKAATDK